jgi:hypothetical protein
MGEMRNAYKILIENVEERENSEDVGIDEKVILAWILGK